MISQLSGTVLRVAQHAVVVSVGGVGFQVAVTPPTALAAHTGGTIALHTKLIVREDELSLYGFDTIEALDAFELLIGVSGVGPKSALGVLAHLTPAQLRDAVDLGDEAAFKRVSGIGPKTAKLIIVQLTGKVHAAASDAIAPTAVSSLGPDVLMALTGLGWPERAAQDAIDRAIAADASVGATSATLLRAALAALGPKGAA